MKLVDWIVLATTVFAYWKLSNRSLQSTKSWQIVITPLASIIGSGFLVAAPLLGALVGRFSPAIMALIVLVAYSLGSIIRFNILHTEPILEEASNGPTGLLALENFSSLTLACAYVISVAFYLRLLSSFALSPFDIEGSLIPKISTSVILTFIGLVGLKAGLTALERLERHAVTIKLTIIGALFSGLLVFDLNSISTINREWTQNDTPLIETLRYLAGMLLIVQGFETPRYLGATYARSLRANSVRHSQIISGIIYVTFVTLALPLLTHMGNTTPDETAIIELAGIVSFLLPALLVIAAIMSQFSAAVADTVGAGGLAATASHNRISTNVGYCALTIIAGVLVWFANIFEIISLASRMFALYYLLQAIIAFRAAGIIETGNRRYLLRTQFSVLIVLLTLIVLFAKSVE